MIENDLDEGRISLKGVDLIVVLKYPPRELCVAVNMALKSRNATPAISTPATAESGALTARSSKIHFHMPLC